MNLQDIQQILSTTVVVESLKPTPSPKHRSTKTPNNAMRFKPHFDKMIVERVDLRIESKDCGLVPRSLYVLANDALGWLSEYSEGEEKEKYKNLRSEIVVRVRGEGIEIWFKPHARLITLVSKTIQPEVISPWRKLEKELEKAVEGELIQKKMLLNEQQQAEIKEVCKKFAGCEFDVSDVGYRIVK